MDRIWLKNYPEGVPADIDPGIYSSLVEMFDEAFSKYRDRDAYVCMGRRMRFGELDRYSQALGVWLQSCGLEKGARVAVMMPNCLQYPIAIAGILRAGYVVVNVNPLYTPRELEHQLKDSGAEAIVILENFATTLEKVIHQVPVKHVVVAALGDMLGLAKGSVVNFVLRKVKKMVPAWRLPSHVTFKQVLQLGGGGALRPVSLSAQDNAFLQYTGGTTGVSKGAVLTHRNVVANVLQSEVWLKPGMPDLGQQYTMVCALPLYHIFALTICGLLGMRIGALNILITNPKDIPAFIKELGKYPFNILPAVNTLFNALLNHPDFAKLDFSSFKLGFGGGMAVQRVVADRWFQVTGKPIIEGYGLSETSPVATGNPANGHEYTGAIGMPISSTDVAIRDDEGNDLPLGQSGEICIRGPQVMEGYWNRPDETAKVMMADGFFRTGDVGVMDARGYVRIVDRKKDMVLVSGFNVYPNEVEEVVSAHPGVMEVAAVGVPDSNSGEAVKIFVVKKDAAVTEAEILEWCRERLTNYKRPKYIEFRSELPKTNVGKILRRALRDQ